MAWDDLEEIISNAPIKVIRLKCDRIRFNTGSAVFLPAGLSVLRAVLQWQKEHADQKVLIASHTDRAGGADANQKLSDERSQSTLMVLEQHQEEWADFILEQRKGHSAETKKADVDTILSWAAEFMNWPTCAPGKAKPIAAFKTEYEKRFKAQDDDPDTDVADRVFWMRVHNVYVYRLRKLLDILDDDTTTYEGYLDGLKWLEPKFKAIGCGERRNLVPNDDGKAEPENRRTEFLFFEPDGQPKKPDADGEKKGPKGEPPAWLESFYEPDRARFKELPCPRTSFFRRELPAGNICFVIDISASMSGERLLQAKLQLVGALQDLEETDYVTVVAFGDQVITLWSKGNTVSIQLPQAGGPPIDYLTADPAHGGRPTLKPATAANVKEAIAWVNAIGMGPSTQTAPALKMALTTIGFSEDKEAKKTLEFLSDGCPSARAGKTMAQEQQLVLGEVKANNTRQWIINVTLFFPAAFAKKNPGAVAGLEKFCQDLAKTSEPDGAYLKRDFEE